MRGCGGFLKYQRLQPSAIDSKKLLRTDGLGHQNRSFLQSNCRLRKTATQFLDQLQADFLDVSSALSHILVLRVAQQIDEEFSGLNNCSRCRPALSHSVLKLLAQQDVARHCKLCLKHSRACRGQAIFQFLPDPLTYGFQCIFDFLQLDRKSEWRLSIHVARKCDPAEGYDFALADTTA